MNEREITQVVAILTSGWPGWSDETIALWWHEMRAINVTVDDAVQGARALLAGTKFRPSWAEFRAEALRFKRDRELHEAEARALAPAGDDDAWRQRAINAAGLRTLRSAVREREQAWGHSVPLDAAGMGIALNFGSGARGHQHRNGRERCPLCGKHDHADRRTIGFKTHVMWRENASGHRERIEQREPVAAYELTCLRCWPDHPDLVADTWTSEGGKLLKAVIAWRTALRSGCTGTVNTHTSLIVHDGDTCPVHEHDAPDGYR